MHVSFLNTETVSNEPYSNTHAIHYYQNLTGHFANKSGLVLLAPN